jgi:3-isopropylmalate/(R)-2-methylmalate dehydratase small subunit
MQKFEIHTGLVAPLPRANVDTDVIIPKQFLKSIRRTGFGPNLFDQWRYLDRAEPGMDNARRPLNPEFVLNQPRYQGASILLTAKNFGCGSSREHAAWALLDAGFRVVIAPSFADIFRSNAIGNGMLPIALPEPAVNIILDRAERGDGYRVSVNLEQCEVRDDLGLLERFAIDASSRSRLLEGLDEIDVILAHEPDIAEFERQRVDTLA